MLNKVHNSTKYTNIPDDCLDTRIPLFSDDAFKQGIVYEAKYIGSMDVARPQNRLEIVSAMRRIRFEFKAKAVKKERIYFKISTDGVFVNLRTKKKTPMKLRLSQSFNIINGTQSETASSSLTPGLLLMHHPIYRIFYVSHDSQDLKIFSYIARDSKSTNFKCNVFKALRKMEAMKIVRTVGQAFDVCHRLNQKNDESKSNSDCNQTPDNDTSNNHSKTDKDEDSSVKKTISSSQSAQPIRSADLIKIDDDIQSDSQSGSVSTLDDILNHSSKKKCEKKAVPNSQSEPSIKSHSNGLSEEKKLTIDSFLSSYLFLNYLITNQLSELTSSYSEDLTKSTKVHQPNLETLMNHQRILCRSFTSKVSATQLELLKTQLEEEIKFRIKCQSQIEALASQNRLLSTFIKRTFEEIRHSQCESCMLRLSALDINSSTDAPLGFRRMAKPSSTTDIDLNQILAENNRFPDGMIKSSTIPDNFFRNNCYDFKTSDAIDFFMDPSEKEIAFDELDFYRNIDDSLSRNFYKMSSWNLKANDHSMDLKSLKKNSNNLSQCTSETSIANSQEDKFNDVN